MHSMRMIHTDIKPENILFINSAFEVVPSKVVRYFFFSLQ